MGFKRSETLIYATTQFSLANAHRSKKKLRLKNKSLSVAILHPVCNNASNNMLQAAPGLVQPALTAVRNTKCKMKFQLIYMIENLSFLDLDGRTLSSSREGGGGEFLLCQIGTLGTATPVTGTASLTAFTGHTMAVERLSDLLPDF